MNKTCSCGGKFMDPEDFRDHMPCPGSEAEQAMDRYDKLLEENSRLKIENEVLRGKFKDAVDYLRFLLEMIERTGEHAKRLLGEAHKGI